MSDIFNTTPFLLLEDNLSAADETGALLFSDPVSLISCRQPAECGKCLRDLDHALAEGYYIAGWISYEAAAGFEARLQTPDLSFSGEPLIWFGVFREPEFLTKNQITNTLAAHSEDRPAQALAVNLRASETEESYLKALDAIQTHLAAGDIYQANYTFRLLFDLIGDPVSFYARLREAQPVGYGAYIDTGAWRIISRSPELFIARSKDKLIARPMKGTAARGLTLVEDQKISRDLAADEKSQAENLMIVDLIRNDLSSVANAGPVQTKNLFRVKRFPTLFQMTTDIEAEVPNSTRFSDSLAALFPCGSVTGAPKLSAMEILRKLERQPRGIYTGAIGYAAPDGAFCFNVPIRTLISGEKGECHMGIGSGVVADSDPALEYQECRLKARFLTSGMPRFDLIETLLWRPNEGYRLFDLHMKRLAASARYFDFQFRRNYIASELENAAADLHPPDKFRVRLLLSRSGNVSVTAQPIKQQATAGTEPDLIRLHPVPVNRDDPFLYHKTTRRQFYDTARRDARENHGCDDVIFQNRQGQLTETAIANLFIRRGGLLLTPPVDSGLLPGTFRESLLKSSGRTVREKILTVEDLLDCDEILTASSVRGLCPVRLSRT